MCHLFDPDDPRSYTHDSSDPIAGRAGGSAWQRMKPILFFSHSSADNTRAEALVTALEKRETFKTTFDIRDLKHGEGNAPQLFKWLARCHGAVLLLTQNVMQKAAWVLQEATVLRARSRLEGSSFRLFVVIDQDVLASRVWKRWFAPLGLDALQRMTVVDPDHIDVKAIVDAISEAMAGVADGSEDFFSRLAASLQDPLKPVVQNASISKTLADRLDEPDAAWQQLIGGAGVLDALFARRLCRGDFGSFGGMKGSLPRCSRCKRSPGCSTRSTARCAATGFRCRTPRKSWTRCG